MDRRYRPELVLFPTEEVVFTLNDGTYTLVSIGGYAACIWYGLKYPWLAKKWISTCKAYRGFPLKNGVKLFRAFIMSENSNWLWATVGVGLFLIFAVFCLNWRFPTSFIISFVLFAAYLPIYQSTPPSILVLGPSNPDTSHLRMLLEKRFFPVRVVALLEPRSIANAYQTVIYRNIANWDNLRSRSKHWQGLVRMLIKMAPTIVVDATEYSKAVEEEIGIVASLNLFPKALLLIGRSDWSGISSNTTCIHREIVGSVADENSIVSHVERMGNLRRLPVDI